MRRMRVERPRSGSRRERDLRNEVLRLDPRDADVVRVKSGGGAPVGFIDRLSPVRVRRQQ
jgi:hypothetical protein